MKYMLGVITKSEMYAAYSGHELHNLMHFLSALKLAWVASNLLHLHLLAKFLFGTHPNLE